MRHAPTVLTIVALLSACSDDRSSLSPYPYDPGETRIIGGSRGDDGNDPFGNAPTGGTTSPAGAAPVAVFDPDSCVLDEACERPQQDCGPDATADVILGPDGQVLSVLCYPTRGAQVVVIGDDLVRDPELGNNTVVVLDGLDDGVDIEGDLSITGNNVVVYGQGPDTSVIGGNVSIDKNNAIVRGVRIQGDVTITKNNAALVWCVIEGDLTITGNNVSLALCEVWGEVNIVGLNTVFVSNAVQGEQPLSGMNLQCNDNHRFEDLDDDGVIDEDELGEPIVCESRGLPLSDDADLMP